LDLTRNKELIQVNAHNAVVIHAASDHEAGTLQKAPPSGSNTGEHQAGRVQE
jgi:hypothetical protein